MTNKEVCLKYQEIEEKAIKIAKQKETFFHTSTMITNNGIIIANHSEYFGDPQNNFYCGEQLITWEDLNE